MNKNEKEKILKDEKLMHEVKTLLINEEIVKNLIVRHISKAYPNEAEIKKINKKAKRIIDYIKSNQDNLIYHLNDEYDMG